MSNFFADVYNKEIKERFLQEIDIKQYPFRWWERIFEKSVIFEEQRGKDLYSFTVSEIREFYMYLNVGLEPLIVANTNLIKYGNWALANNMIIDGQNHFDELDNEILNTCVNKALLERSVLTFDKFEEMIRGFINDQDKYICY